MEKNISNINKKILVMTGGGTGGHIMPNIALLPYLTPHFKIYYLGEKNGLEEKLMANHKEVTFIPIKAVKFARKLTPKNLTIPYKMIKNIRQTKKILKEIKPNVIFTKGGYVSLPVALAGSKLKIPILAHESDFSMGLANKIIQRKAKVMFTSFRETCISNKCVYSGSPIREEVLQGNKEIAQKFCHFSNLNKTTIMFFGGSMGSQAINRFVIENLDGLEYFNVIHFVGKNNSTLVNRPNYCQIEFAENIYDFFALADIVICRAGANSIFELCALQKLMLLIPLPAKQSRGDQLENAKSFKNQGLADVLQQDDLTLENLLSKINNLQKNKFYFVSNMKKINPLGANELISNYLLQYARSPNKKPQN